MFFSDSYKKMISLNPVDSSHMLWNLTAGTSKKCFMGLQKNVARAIFTPDESKILAISPQDSSAQLRDAVTDSILISYHFPKAIFPYASFSPDSKSFLIPMNATPGVFFPARIYAIINATKDSVIKIDSTHQNLTSLNWWGGGDVSLIYSPDGSKIVAGDEYNVVVMDATTGETLLTYLGKGPVDGYINDQQRWFSPEGNSVLMPFSNSQCCTNGLAEFNINQQQETMRFLKQNRPSISYSGFSEKGEALFIGQYYYSGSYIYTGYYKWDTISFWNGETDKEFMKRMHVTQPQVGGSFSSKFFFFPDGKGLLQENWYYNSSFNESSKTDISIYDISDTGKCIYSGQGEPSQDCRSVYIFIGDSCKTINLQTGDSSMGPFNQNIKTFSKNNGNYALSPDGKHYISGNSCYNVLTGAKERVYLGMTGYVTFNPVNPKQFISGPCIWELPNAASVQSPAKETTSGRFHIISATSARLIIDLPSTPGNYAIKATLKIYQLNGRKLTQIPVIFKGTRQSITLPNLANGTYVYRFEIPSHSINIQGKIIIR
jgi:hypothetical protein